MTEALLPTIQWGGYYGRAACTLCCLLMVSASSTSESQWTIERSSVARPTCSLSVFAPVSAVAIRRRVQ